jgi:hypothetical protein
VDSGILDSFNGCCLAFNEGQPHQRTRRGLRASFALEEGHYRKKLQDGSKGLAGALLFEWGAVCPRQAAMLAQGAPHGGKSPLGLIR